MRFFGNVPCGFFCSWCNQVNVSSMCQLWQKNLCSHECQSKTFFLMSTEFSLHNFVKSQSLLAALRLIMLPLFDHCFVQGTVSYHLHWWVLTLHLSYETVQSPHRQQSLCFCNNRNENDISMGIAFCTTKFCVTKCCGYQNRMLEWQEPTLCQNAPSIARRLSVMFVGT